MRSARAHRFERSQAFGVPGVSGLSYDLPQVLQRAFGLVLKFLQQFAACERWLCLRSGGETGSARACR